MTYCDDCERLHALLREVQNRRAWTAQQVQTVGSIHMIYEYTTADAAVRLALAALEAHQMTHEAVRA